MYHPYGALPVPLYVLICPDVATKYPRAHRCYPQYLFFNSWNSHCNFLLLFSFIYCTTFDTDRYGGAEISICTWSGPTFPHIIGGANFSYYFYASFGNIAI